MNGARFAAPAVISLILVELLGLVDVIAYLRRHSRPAVIRAVGIAAAAGLVASSISLHPLPAPAWHITSADDRSLIASGGYRSQRRRLPPRVRSGQLVASSEVGYLGFSDRRHLTAARHTSVLASKL